MAVVIDDFNFRIALDRYLREYPREVASSMRIRARLLFTRISKQLPPRTKGQGSKRVRADVRKAANPLNPQSFNQPAIRKAVQGARVDVIRQIVENSASPALKGKRVEPFNPHQHRLARDSSGRVPESQKLLVVGMGAWKKYVRFRQQRVGLLRAAFALPVTYFGGAISRWLEVPKDLTAGRIQDNLATKNEFIFTCTLPYADRYERYIRSSLAYETKAMIGDLKRALATAARNSKL